ncbi:MAG: DUF72 domain-containing protein [Nitrospirota bacterium]
MEKNKTGAAYIGTSGWNYKHWKGPFYPDGMPDSKLLEFYSRRFRTVELNTTFYHLPLETSVKSWRDSVPEDFIFAVKASRFITHIKRLKDAGDAVKTLLGRMKPLGRKMGPVLFQLPPTFGFDISRLEEFLDALPRGPRYAFELRNQAWFKPETYDTLSRHGAAFCVYDLKGVFAPREVTSSIVYFRLHGPGGAYAGSYGDDFLSGLAQSFARWIGEGKDVYCYFDNDEAGYAAKNALKLSELMEAYSAPRAA